MNDITPGKYLARACGPDVPDNVQWGAANSGNTQVALRFALLDEEGKSTDTTIWWVGTFDDKPNAKGTTASDITCRALRNCGWRGDDFGDLRGIDSEDVELDIQEDTYEGNTRLRVKWVNRPGSGSFSFSKPLGSVAIADLSKKLKGKLVAMDQKDGGAARGQGNQSRRPQPNGSGGQRSDDKVPF
jgi:hypothetical protein